MKRIRIVLAHEHRILRQGLRLLINRQRDMRVVGEAAQVREVEEKLHTKARRRASHYDPTK